MSFFSKIQLKTAVSGRDHHDLSCSHTTSFDFCQVRPTYYRTLVPNDKLKCDIERFVVRTAPLTYPAFGNAKFIHRGFFVPYRLVDPRYHEFIENKSFVNSDGLVVNAGMMSDKLSHFLAWFLYEEDYGVLGARYSGTPVSDPTQYDGTVYYQNDFVRVRPMLTSATGTMKSPVVNQDYPSDFCYSTAHNGKVVNMQAEILPLGRYVLKVMNSLGNNIKFPFRLYDWDEEERLVFDVPETLDVDYNFLTVLCFFKVILDNYVPSQYHLNSPLQVVLQNFFVHFFDGSLDQLGLFSEDLVSFSTLNACFKTCAQCFAGSDYFTTAWQSETEVIPGFTTKTQFKKAGNFGTGENVTIGENEDTAGSNNSVSLDERGVQFDGNSVGQLQQNASATGHKWLNGIYNWIERSQWSGSRAVESILAKFGVRVPNYRLQYSEYLGKKISELTIGDVTQQASTDVGTLGQQAGKGYAVGTSGDAFTYEAKDYGIFIVVTTLVSSGGYVQGIDRLNTTFERDEFFQPSLQKTGNQPIGQLEFMAPPSTRSKADSDAVQNNLLRFSKDGVFGFLPRYSWMRFQRDFLTGDFEIPHLGGGTYGQLNGYHMYRMFGNPFRVVVQGDGNVRGSDYAQQGVTPIAQKEILFDNGTQYGRIFNVTDNQQDHFHGEFYFKVSLESDLLSFSNSIDVDGFREVNIQPNGEVTD